MNISFQKDAGAYVELVNGLNTQTKANTTAVDNVAITGKTVDRKVGAASSAANSLWQGSGKVGVQYDYSLASTVTLTLTGVLQHTSNSTGTWATLTDKDGSSNFSVTVGTTGSTATQTGGSVLHTDLDLAKAKRYVRVKITPNWSATSTAGGSDVDLGAQWALAGYNVLPGSTS